MSTPGRKAQQVQSHPASVLIVNIAALIGGIVAAFVLADIFRRMFLT